ncbi:TetR/AcrR family transcriptional regulator [Actinomadura harenae]|uniref:TetR/AcrR family transcriptional regulator n=1 Tax=Actinomadura harenae TaxID=2483351 RepID=A0A3M2M923_9ACTN|nr:TetR/AcrR family transcriptional regulator [Actinomadura harenae]RMI46294.1 TetR/AcrR family transcriptional regulator [Actinomadura harenae]
MSVQQRRERERADRRRLIVQTARELAEAEGWGAVTTRRLSELVQYSQPVLYSHFKGKAAIVAAVAVEGITDLAADLRAAREEAADDVGALRGIARAYLDFAAEHPAAYDAMFVQPIDVTFGTGESPQALRDAFQEFMTALRPFAGERDPETFAELGWSWLHGLAMLTKGERLRPEHAESRLGLLVDALSRG